MLLSKAFDSVSLKMLKIKLKRILPPDSKMLSLIIKIIDNKNYRVLYNGEETSTFKLENGVPQGDSMSPTLFSLFINDMFDDFKKNMDSIDPVEIAKVKISTVVYADDILLMSQSSKGLINQIRLLQNYCRANGLTINYDKTKIMIHNIKPKFSRLEMTSENIFHSIEVVEEFKYLGMWISKNNTKHIENLEKTGKKSSFFTSKILKEFGHINGNMLKETFEMLTLSKMRYCGELCFYENLSALNRIQVQFYKRFCHLKITTPNYCIFGEFGLQPIEFHFYKAALTYWTKLITNNEKSLVKEIYTRMVADIDEKRFSKTWCWRLKTLLEELKLNELWDDQTNANKLKFQQIITTRIKDYFREKWIDSAKESKKGLNYLELSLFNCEIKSYLNLIIDDKSVNKMLKLRTGNHTLQTEVDRYRNKKAYEECICKACEDNKIEDLYHVIVECPKYLKIRVDKINFVLNCKRTELYSLLNNLSMHQIKQITQFMSYVEDIKK